MATTQGTIVQSIGAVIDIEFPREGMPGIYEALILEDTDRLEFGSNMVLDWAKLEHAEA